MPGELARARSSSGIDVLLSARRVGPTGKARGLDMTDGMLVMARENQRKAGFTNVEFAALGPRKKSSLLDKFALYGNSWPNKWISRIQGQGGDRGDQGRADDPPKIGTPGWNKSETAGLSLSTLKNEGIQFVLPYDPAELPESKERYHLGKNSFRCAMNLFLAHLPISEVAAKAPNVISIASRLPSGSEVLREDREAETFNWAGHGTEHL